MAVMAARSWALSLIAGMSVLYQNGADWLNAQAAAAPAKAEATAATDESAAASVPVTTNGEPARVELYAALSALSPVGD